MSEELTRLLARHRENPDDPELNYQCAVAHDRLGLEREAVAFYLKAIAGDLPADRLRSALLGLGSTYRAIGDYESSVEIFDRGIATFPDAAEFVVFKSMALHNLGETTQAMSMLLKTVATTSNDEGVNRYRRAILFYADHLDQTW